MSKLLLVCALVGAGLVPACTKTEAMTPDRLSQQYGVTGAYSETFPTSDGSSMRGTVVPVTLADGRRAELVIPVEQRNEPHGVYLRDSDGVHPVQIQDRSTRNQIVQSPSVVTRRAEPTHTHKRSWEKDAMIIGGGAGGGALIGALAGGKKGAAVGAAGGGVGALIYDLATRNKH